MPQRNALKGIAHGLLGTFISRNNDIAGYWGLGVLRLFAKTNKHSELKIELLEQKPESKPQSPIRTIIANYRQWLLNALKNAGIHTKQLEAARIDIRFTTFDAIPDAIRDTRGEPYVCTVSLHASNGRTYRASKIGVCSPHDPKREARSTRVE